MTKKEKLIILLGLSCLADKFAIKDIELAKESQNNKIDLELEKSEIMFKDEDDFKKHIIGLFRKYVNYL